MYTEKTGSSYPTYEEWKPCPPVSKAFLNTRSYPTYEEWKHKASCNANGSIALLFLSYL